MMFAKLQLAQAEICKAQAEDYMKQIETIQEEQEKCAKMIEEARNCQQKSKDDEGTGSKSITGKTVGDGCFAMSQELIDYMDKYGLSYPNDDKDYILGTDEWDYALKSLTNYQETIGNKTQTLMVYLQDFIGQYSHSVPYADLPYPCQFLPCPDTPCRIMWIAQNHKLHSGIGRLFLKIVKVYPECVPVPDQRIADHLAAVVPYRRKKAVIYRRLYQDLVSGHSQSFDYSRQGRDDTRYVNHPVPAERPAMPSFKPGNH